MSDRTSSLQIYGRRLYSVLRLWHRPRRMAHSNRWAFVDRKSTNLYDHSHLANNKRNLLSCDGTASPSPAGSGVNIWSLQPASLEDAVDTSIRAV